MALYTLAFPQRLARRWMAAEAGPRARYLAVNVRDESDAFLLTALVPGLKAEDLSIQVLEDFVRIEGTVGQTENEYLLQELPSGSFRRELRLPAPLDADKVEARIEDGILTLRLPKAEIGSPAKHQDHHEIGVFHVPGVWKLVAKPDMKRQTQ